MSDLINTVNSINVHVPGIFITIDEYNKLLEKIGLLEKEKSQLEIRKNCIQQQFDELSLSTQKYIQEINILKEEKALLEKNILELNERINNLENNKIKDNERINSLEKQVSELIKEKYDNDSMLKKSQCIYLYKNKLKNKIFINLDDDDIQKWDLFDILNNKYDDNMESEECKRRDDIVNHLNNKYKKYEYYNKRLKKTMKGIDIFHSYIKNISKERNSFAHPNITNEELIKLKNDFITNMNEKDKIKEKQIINDIFEVLLN